MAHCILKRVSDNKYRCQVCKKEYHANVITQCMPIYSQPIQQGSPQLNSVNCIEQQVTFIRTSAPCCGEQTAIITSTRQMLTPASSTNYWNDGWCFFVEDTSRRTATSTVFVCVLCKRLESNIPLGVPADKLARLCTNPVPLSIVEKYDELQKMPSIVQRLGRYGAEYLRHVKLGRPECSLDEILDRYKICLLCSKHNKTDHICMACGCFINTKLAKDGLNKLSWKDTHCEDGKWKEID